MIHKLRKVRILSLKSSIVASLLLEYKKKFCKAPRWCTHQVLNHSKWTKNEEDMRQELATSLEQLSLILFLVFSPLLLYL
jgi:hypothetical protein